MRTRILLTAPLSLTLLACGACDRVSFSFHDVRPVHEVVVVETHPAHEVYVVETHPVHTVHVVETHPVHHDVHVVETHPAHHDVHVVATHPVLSVGLHFDTHVCGHHCNHYYNGTTFITLGTSHRHSSHCGHHFNGKHWVTRKGNAHKASRHHYKSKKRKHKKHR